MDQNVNVTVASDKDGISQLIIREGKAVEWREDLVISEKGDIETVKNYIAGRTFDDKDNRQAIDKKRSLIVIDKDNLSITLQVNPQDYYGPKVSGHLVKTNELLQFKINDAFEFNREQLVKLIKFNKRFFTNAAKHDTILRAYQSLQLKANTQLKDASDNRGGQNFQYEKQIDRTNIPVGFSLEMSIYKGQPKVKFDVEICFESTEHNVKFWLESAELAELLEVKRDEIFAEQQKHFGGFVVINK